MSKLEFNYWFVLIRAAGTFCVEPSPLQTTGEKCCQNEVRGTKFKFQVEGTIVVTGFYSVYFFKEKLKKKNPAQNSTTHSQTIWWISPPFKFWSPNTSPWLSPALVIYREEEKKSEIFMCDHVVFLWRWTWQIWSRKAVCQAVSQENDTEWKKWKMMYKKGGKRQS